MQGVEAAQSGQAAMGQGLEIHAGTLASAGRDAETPSTDPKFGEIWKQLQSKYGEKAQKPREIKKSLGKDDFLRIMVTQMQHQDPTEPFKADQMAAQMAQFASVEQLQNLNQSFGRMAGQQQPLERLAMTGMIGKVVTVDRDRFPHADGSKESLGYLLSRDAAQARITIQSETGETVYEKDLGPQRAGQGSFTWDGSKTNSVPAKAGNYVFRIDATDDRGQPIEVGAQAKAKVVGVSFEGSEPVFLLGDLARPEKATLRNLVRVEVELGGSRAIDPGATAEGAQPAVAPEARASMSAVPLAEKKPSFIAFQKGVGSSNLDLNQLTPEVREAIAKYKAQAVAEPGGSRAQGEMGFPNGLQEAEAQEGAVLDPGGSEDDSKGVQAKGGDRK